MPNELENAMDDLRAAEQEATQAYAQFYRVRQQYAGRDALNDDEAFQAIDQASSEYERARLATERARTIAERLGGMQIGLRPGQSLIVGHPEDFFGRRLTGRAGVELAEYWQRVNAASQPSGGAQLSSILGTHMALPVGGRYGAAIDVTGGGGKAERTVSTGFFSTSPHRRLSVLDLIPSDPVDGLGGQTLEYFRQTVSTGAAAVTAQLADKPASTISLERTSTSLYTVATISEQVPKQLLAGGIDAQRWVEYELGRFVLEACEAYALSGAGTTEPEGITVASGTLTQASTGSPTETIRKAITQLENVNVLPEALVLNPSDWETVELETDAEGQYFLGGPRADSLAGVWRVPVIPSTGLSAGTAILGNFAFGCRRWDGISALQWGTIDDDFQKNAVRLVAEQGFGFAVVRANHFVKVTL